MKIFWNYRVIHKGRLNSLNNCIIAANHISLNDPPFIGSIIPIEINYLAKSELFKNRIFAKFLTYMNAIPIQRGKVDRIGLRKVEEKLENGQSILLFPEGTRKSSKAKAGIGKIAIQTRKDIFPIYIKNSNHFFKCFLRKERLKIVIGEKIIIKPFLEKGEGKETYRNLANYTLKKINELENDC